MWFCSVLLVCHRFGMAKLTLYRSFPFVPFIPSFGSCESFVGCGELCKLSLGPVGCSLTSFFFFGLFVRFFCTRPLPHLIVFRCCFCCSALSVCAEWNGLVVELLQFADGYI